jgi:hypothetical protein
VTINHQLQAVPHVSASAPIPARGKLTIARPTKTLSKSLPPFHALDGASKVNRSNDRARLIFILFHEKNSI